MPVMMNQVSVAAGANNNNLVAGSAYEIARRRQVVSIGLTASVTGSFATIQAGSDVIAEEFPPPVKATYPIIPDEMYFTDVMEPGDRMILRVRNPTAGAIVFNFVVQVQEVTR